MFPKFYFISSIMADRIDFDSAIRQFIEELELLPEATETTFEQFWEIAATQFFFDDPEEAKARALSVWNKMKQQHISDDALFKRIKELAAGTTFDQFRDLVYCHFPDPEYIWDRALDMWERMKQ